MTGWLRELMFGWFVDSCFGLSTDWLIIELEQQVDLRKMCMDEWMTWWWRDWLELPFDDFTKGSMSKWVKSVFIEWMIMRLGSERICKVYKFVNGLLCEMVIWYFGEQVFVLNVVRTNWWWSETLIKCMDDFRLGLFTDILIHWVVGWLADRSI